MTNDTIKLFSSIKPTLLRYSLIRGTLIALCGVFLLAYGGTFLGVEALSIWGVPLLLTGIGLIALGLIPYRRLCRFEKSPNEIIIDGGGFLQFIERGKLQYSIPLANIEKVNYYEQGHDYGVGIHLKQPAAEKVMIHNPRFNAACYQSHSRKKYHCDLYIPYFGRRAFTRLALYFDTTEPEAE